MDTIENAIHFIQMAHIGQKRKYSGLPYVVHPIEVMKRISGYGIRHAGDLVSALVHDVHEDCSEMFSSMVLKSFGPYVYRNMIECSYIPDDKYTKDDYIKSFKHKSPISLIIKIADRYCNVQDFIRSGNKKYAKKYAKKAQPLYDIFVNSIKNDTCYFDDDIVRKVLMDIAELIDPS